MFSHVHCLTNVTVTWDHYIVVNQVNGSDVESCTRGHTPCESVNMALKGLVHNSTMVSINTGTYLLKSGHETKISQLTRLAIIGIGQVVIKCVNQSGIELFKVNNLSIESITLVGCGMNVLLPAYNPYDFSNALLIHSCNNVFLNRLNIEYSNGTPVHLFMTRNVTITNCFISNSQAELPPTTALRKNVVYVRGGGIFVWFSVFSNTSKQKSFINIVNTTVTDNELAVREPDNDVLQLYVSCLVNAPDMGGITVSWFPSIEMTIESCLLMNNSRGFHFNSLNHANIILRNVNISSNQNNESVIFSLHNSSVNLQNVYADEYVSLRFREIQQSLVEYIPNGYRYTYSSPVNMSMDIVYDTLGVNASRIALRNENKYCLDREYTEGICSAEYNDHTGLCPRYYSKCLVGFECNCTDHHIGRLCGDCIEGFSVVVNSPYLSCAQCNSTDIIIRGWAILIGLEFIPITVLVAIIALVNVNLNQGSLNAFIFFCQILTISFPSVGYPSWMITQTISYVNWDEFVIFLLPFSMWNLDFITILSKQQVHTNISNTYAFFDGIPVCISSLTTPLGAIFFWYVIAIYPFFLLAVLYVIIVFYNKGYRGVVIFVRPLHRRLAKFWRMFNIEPSLSHTVASLYTLCFTQLAAISLKLLHPTWYADSAGNNGELVFFYEGSRSYFDAWHTVSVLVALFVLLILMSFTLYLALHPFKTFQKLLIKIKIKKDMLISLTDVFTAPFKNGTQTLSWDYRYFSSILFLLRLLIMLLYYLPPSNDYLFLLPILQINICGLYICTIVVFRPYKRNIHVYNEMIIFALLIFYSIFFYFPDSETMAIVNYDFYWYKRLMVPSLVVILFFSVVPYCFIWIVKKLKSVHFYLLPPIRSTDSFTDVTQLNTELENFSSSYVKIPDRLENPEKYYDENLKLRTQSKTSQ